MPIHCAGEIPSFYSTFLILVGAALFRFCHIDFFFLLQCSRFTWVRAVFFYSAFVAIAGASYPLGAYATIDLFSSVSSALDLLHRPSYELVLRGTRCSGCDLFLGGGAYLFTASFMLSLTVIIAFWYLSRMLTGFESREAQGSSLYQRRGQDFLGLFSYWPTTSIIGALVGSPESSFFLLPDVNSTQRLRQSGFSQLETPGACA